MSNFNIEILENNNNLDIDASAINILEVNETSLSLDPESSDGVFYNLELEQSELITLQINTEYVGSVIFASDIINLDTFIANFIDTYEIDCGSP